MPEEFDVCIDTYLPLELQEEAKENALRVNPANALEITEEGLVDNQGRLALEIGKFWPVGSTIRIHFMDGDSATHEKVKEHSKGWIEHANINFEFVNDPNAEVRISFRKPGYWSYVGTEALSVSKNQPTMNFSGLTTTTPEKVYQRKIPHEFGHMLGCIHEHQNPDAGILWDKKAAYSFYQKRGLSKKQVDSNIFNTYKREQARFSDFDPKSIMLYPIPPGLTTDGFSVELNRSLSETDKKFIGIVYPKQVHQARLISLECVSSLNESTDHLTLKIYGEDSPHFKGISMSSGESASLEDIPLITFDKDGHVRIDLQVRHSGNKLSLGEFSINQADQGGQVQTFREGNAVYELSYEVVEHKV